MIRKHEGAEAGRLAEQWLALQRAGALVCRDAEKKIVGTLVMVALDEAPPELIAADPATAAAAAYLAAHAPLRAGERATHFRFWMTADVYQTVSPTQSLIFVQMVRHYLTTPGLAFTMIPCSEPEFWAPVFGYADLARLPEADFTVAGRRYGVYGHDWRATPPLAWLELLAERETAVVSETAAPPAAPEAVVVLSEEEFGAAVQDALRHLHQPSALRSNPLLRSRLVVDRAGASGATGDRIAALQVHLREAVDGLRESPRDHKLYRALQHTYVQPAATQEQAAELLDLPFSTFRRHLKAGSLRVAELLWQREIGWLGK
jgi:hypothetical protein